MQSHDYVPGVSGWKIEGGNIELNAATIQAGGLPSGPQLITVTAGEWPDSELPSNGIERYAFIGAELAKIPAEFRDSAEFKTEDFSFDRDSSDYRTTLTYERRETAEEVAARQKKVEVAGSSTSFKDGVMTVAVDGVVRIRLGNLEKSEAPPPFIVIDGATYISEAEVERGSITKAKIESNWSVRLQLDSQGRYFTAGIGIGIADSVIVTEISARASADEAISSRIGALETRIGLLVLDALATKGAIDAGAAPNRK